jgi:bifunctional UDP-N-acetylglucosamine pyrophosphorylase/glucosamine-1-phosphate N-acetyltransferase
MAFRPTPHPMSAAPHSTSAPAAIILAAGKGTRMAGAEGRGGDLPKVVHEVGGRPMVCPVVDAALAAGCQPVVVVVGYRQDLVRAALAAYPQVRFAIQEQQLGTGHAVLSARDTLEALAREDRPVFILAGDGPLIRPATLRAMLERHRAAAAAATLATSTLDDPTGYGRIIRDEGGRFRAIVEDKNATDDQRRIREVNPSYYCFRPTDLLDALARVQRNPLTGEYYLTDTLALLLSLGRRVEVVQAVPPEDVLSINTPAELAAVDRIYRARQHPPSPSSTPAEARA